MRPAVAIIGAGTLGRELIVQCRRHGVMPRVFDADAAAIENGRAASDRMNAAWGLSDSKRREYLGHLDGVVVEASLEAAIAGAGLVVECLPERIGLKRLAWRQIGQGAAPDAVFATVSSSLLPSQLAPASGRPGRFAALHLLQTTGLVEIMGHAGTEPGVVAFLEDFARRVGLHPVVCRKEVAGYLFNAMMFAWHHQALNLWVRDVADFRDIDECWRRGTGARIGPFQMLDLVGIDTAADITHGQSIVSTDPLVQELAGRLRSLVERGRLGVKSGAGFYEYGESS